VSVELRKGNDPPNHAAVGIAYRIVNTGERAITGLRVGFWVFGPEGTPLPGVVNNYVQASVSETIDAGTQIEICTSLDDVFFYVPDGEVEVSNFRIISVDLEDGSVWSDPLCRFVYPGEIPNVDV